MNVYLDLTREFNAGELRAVLSSGQAVVVHGLAVMSKDGDWILRETEDALAHVRSVLAGHGARYRFGAPLDVRWMAGGWSSHFEFRRGDLRIRTDFVTRPPRIGPDDLARLWAEQRDAELPCVDVRRLVELKKTNREKDFAVIGELARRLVDPRERLFASRSARDLADLVAAHPDLAREVAGRRPVLAAAPGGVEALERALDAERRELMHANERRLGRYEEAAARWADAWPDVAREVEGRPLGEAHAAVVARALEVLPFGAGEGTP